MRFWLKLYRKVGWWCGLWMDWICIVNGKTEAKKPTYEHSCGTLRQVCAFALPTHTVRMHLCVQCCAGHKTPCHPFSSRPHSAMATFALLCLTFPLQPVGEARTLWTRHAKLSVRLECYVHSPRSVCTYLNTCTHTASRVGSAGSAHPANLICLAIVGGATFCSRGSGSDAAFFPNNARARTQHNCVHMFCQSPHDIICNRTTVRAAMRGFSAGEGDRTFAGIETMHHYYASLLTVIHLWEYWMVHKKIDSIV